MKRLKFEIKWSDLWQWSGTIGRFPYLFYGVLLMALKLGLDHSVWLFIFKAQRPWWGHLFLTSSFNDNGDALPATLLYTLPFLYVGLALTIKRLRSAQKALGWITLFFIPFINLLFFLVLTCLREKPQSIPPNESKQSQFNKFFSEGAVASALMGMVITTLMALAIIWLGVNSYKNYGYVLFVGLPFLLGLCPVLFFAARQRRTFLSCLGVAWLTSLFLGLFMLLLAIEGFLCIMMAAPIAFIGASIGAIIGYYIQRNWDQAQKTKNLFSVFLLLLLMPVFMGAETNLSIHPQVYSVRSAVVIEAPPEVVWQHVIAFSPIPEPSENSLFKVGIAYPLRAKIYGHGVGAVRHCIFSTGPFVEPITVWDEPHILGFSVSKQPPIMKEFSPYPNLQPTHLDNYLQSQRGQFVLTALPDGKTQLEGTTWYTHKIWPQTYWHLWSDAIIHKIHLRVLNHIKDEIASERIRKSG